MSTQYVHGTVADRSGGVVTGASVQLLSAGRIVAETATGSDGQFSLPLPAGQAAEQYTVQAAASGFAPATQLLNAEGATSRLNFTLDVAPYRQSVEVQAAAPLVQSTLDMTGVRESPAKDIGEALEDIDGVALIRRAGIDNDIVIRGLQQDNFNVLVDGSRLYEACPDRMDPAISHLDFAEVDHVDIAKGPFDVDDAGSLGAVVNVVTRSPGMGFSFKPSMSVGSFGYYNPSATVSYGVQKFQILGGYSYRTSDPYKDGSGNLFTHYADYSSAVQGRRAYDINTGWLSMYFTLSDRQRMVFEYTRQQSGPVLYPYLVMDATYDNSDRGVLKYSATELDSPFRNIRAETYFSQVRHGMSDSLRMTALSMDQWSMQADAFSRAIGGRLEGDLGRNTTVGMETYHRTWDMLSRMDMTGVVQTTPAIPDVDTLDGGVYVDYHYTFAERWRFSSGGRYDYAHMSVDTPGASTDAYYEFHNTRLTHNTDDYASGNARLAFGATKSSEFFAGIGTTGRVPDAAERYINLNMDMNPGLVNMNPMTGMNMGSAVTVGNPLLPITRDTQIEAGWSASESRFTLHPEFFYSFLDNYIIVNNQPQINAMMTGSMTGVAAAEMARSYTNVDARLYGGEIGYSVSLTNTLGLYGGGSYTRGTATPVMSVNVMSRNLPEIPPLRAWTSLRYVRRFVFAQIGTVAVDRQSKVDSDLQEVPTAGYVLVNAKLGFTYHRFSASLSADNLLNRFYYDYLSYFRDPFATGMKVPEPGRNIFAQFRYAF